MEGGAWEENAMTETEAMQRLRYYQETGQAEEAKQYEQYLRETGQYEKPGSDIPAVRPDASAALPRDRNNPTGDFQALHGAGGVVPALARTGAVTAMTMAQGIPGVRQLQAKIGSVASRATDSPMTYNESKAALDNLTHETPGDLRTIEELVGGGALDVGAALKIAKPAMRYAPVVGAMAGEVPGLRWIPRIVRAGKRATSAINKAKAPAEKAVEKIGAKVEEGLPNLDDLLIPAEEAAPARTLEDVVEQAATKEGRTGDVVRNASPVKQRGAPKARFEWFAEQQAKKAAEQAARSSTADLAEVPLEDLLSLNLEHIKKGGSLKSASDALRLVRQK